MRRAAEFLTLLLGAAACLAAAEDFWTEQTVCEGCELLAAVEDATCSDYDPVTCKETSSNVYNSFPQFYQIDDNYACDLEPSDICSLSESSDDCALSQVPDDMHLELQYDGQSSHYGITLTWPSLPLSCIDSYHVLDYYGGFADPSTDCNELHMDHNPGCADIPNVTTISFKRNLPDIGDVNYVIVKVVAFPVHVWSVTFRVGDGHGQCIARCGGCSCQYPSSPTNLVWIPDKENNGTGRLTWESQEDPSSIYYHYLHLNSSVTGKVLYRINGKESSALLHNVVGNVSVWMESYSFECGCSNGSESQVLQINLDPVQTSVTTSASTADPMLIASSAQEDLSSLPTSITTSASTANPMLTASSTLPVTTLLTTAGSTKWLVIALPVALSAVILLVIILITFGVIFVQHHRHRTHRLTFFPRVEIICPTFNRNDKEKGDIPAIENGHYNKPNLSSYKPSSQPNFHRAASGSDADENLPRKSDGTGADSSKENGSDQYVLLVFSQDTPAEDQSFIRAYAQQLNKKVSVKMYDASDRLTRTAWLEEHHQLAKAILCVCNSAFANEWTNLSTPLGGSIVSAVRMLVQGKIEHQKCLKRFAVLHLSQEDVDCTPSYLKNVKSFLLGPKEIDSIAHFALSIKEFEYK